MKLSSFLKLSAACVYLLISFNYDIYPILINNPSFILGKKCKKSLFTLFEDAISQFKYMHKSLLHLNKVEFKFFKFIKHKKQYPIFDLVLQTKIISKAINKTFTIKYSFVINKQKFTHLYKFDLNSKNIKTWFYSEMNWNNFLPDHERLCHIQPISPLKTGDIIECHLNLFSTNGILEPDSIQ
jgi:hypothetical protein